MPLEVRDLRMYYEIEGKGWVKAVDGVSFTLKEEESLGIVGESGCGKSVTALSIMRLIPDPPGKIVSGNINFEGVDLLKLPMSKMREIRGNKIAMIFQEPMSSLNPSMSCGKQVREILLQHTEMSKKHYIL